MASVLYTTGLVASRAGKLAPVCMLCVAFVLHLFRYVYSEVRAWVWVARRGEEACGCGRVAMGRAVGLGLTALLPQSQTDACIHAMQAVCSLPLNGGSYNILLNATTKGLAAVCACLSVLSYLATGVVSAVRI